MNTHLNKYMGDLYRETMSDKQWLHDISHVGMRMGKACQREQRNQGTHRRLFYEFPTDSSRSTIRGSCETFSLHASCTDPFVIKYVDVQSLYPYVLKTNLSHRSPSMSYWS